MNNTITMFNNDGTYTTYPSMEEFVKANLNKIEFLTGVDVLKSRLSLDKDTIKKLSKEIDDLTDENISLKGRVAQLETRIKGYENDMKGMEKKLKSMKEQDIKEEDVDCPWKSVIVMDWFKDIFEKENPGCIEIEMEDDDEDKGWSLYIRKV